MSSTVTGWPRLGRRVGGRAEGRTGQLRPAAHRRDPETPRRAWSVVVVGRVPGDSTEIGGALSGLEEAAPAAGAWRRQSRAKTTGRVRCSLRIPAEPPGSPEAVTADRAQRRAEGEGGRPGAGRRARRASAAATAR